MTSTMKDIKMVIYSIPILFSVAIHFNDCSSDTKIDLKYTYSRWCNIHFVQLVQSCESLED